jgi:hypothetical protein
MGIKIIINRNNQIKGVINERIYNGHVNRSSINGSSPPGDGSNKYK